jgi:hypothetical protein
MIDDVYNALIELRQIQDEIASTRAERARDKKVQRTRMQSDGRVFDIAEPREWWAKAVKEAKIPHIRWHDLRHTTASRMVQSRKTLKEATRSATLPRIRRNGTPIWTSAISTTLCPSSIPDAIIKQPEHPPRIAGADQFSTANGLGAPLCSTRYPLVIGSSIPLQFGQGMRTLDPIRRTFSSP